MALSQLDYLALSQSSALRETLAAMIAMSIRDREVVEITTREANFYHDLALIRLTKIRSGNARVE